MSKPFDLVQGTLDMLLLKILGLGAMNGVCAGVQRAAGGSRTGPTETVSGNAIRMADGDVWRCARWIGGHGPPAADLRHAVPLQLRQQIQRPHPSKSEECGTLQT
jgi:hypothetical protein